VTDAPVELAADFLLAVRRGEPTESIETTLATVDSNTLAAGLDTDDARLAFWVNIYNAVAQRALADDPGRYESRRQFFSAPLATIAGKSLSLDEIEHSILRRSYSKWTLGYIRTPFRDDFFDKHAPSYRDPRIHFALNCGAQSCPPIAAYSREKIDEQLDWATEGYLDQTVEYDDETVTAAVPRVMLWFRGDFGGKSGIYEFLQRYDQIPDGSRPSLSYLEWDWSFNPGEYTDRERAPVAEQ